MLLRLNEKEQCKWILDRLDESFELSMDSSKTERLRNNSSRLLKAACKALDEFIATCHDATVECEGRIPKVIAHSR